MRLDRIALYLVSSIVLCLGGVLIVVLSSPTGLGAAIGTSLIAGGVASIAFAVIRYVDDLSSDSSAMSLRESVGRLEESVLQQQAALDSLRRATASMGGKSLRVYDRHPQDEVREELSLITGLVAMDVLGFTLRPFCQDWLNFLTTRGEVHLRLITHDPRSDTFDEVCMQESRNPTLMKEDALWVADRVLAAVGKHENLKLEVRWASGYPTITMTHLNDVLFVRPRFLREATQPRLFHERYASEDGLPFTAYLDQFETVWDAAAVPTSADVEAVRDSIHR